MKARLRLWMKRGALAVVAPLALLGLAELALRAAGYGYPADFLVPLDVGGKPKLVDNRSFGRRFFPGQMARTPAPIVIDPRKPAGTIRVVVLGESAAMGEPAQEFGMPRQLQAMLEAALPSHRIEVINAAVTAINSPIILEIARQMADLEPDAFVLYLGNNEVVGPFGPGFVLRPLVGARWYTRAAVAVTRTRVGQYLRGVTARFREGDASAPRAWGGMEMLAEHKVSPQDPRLERVYAAFAQNLRDLLRVTTRSGAPVVLCNMAVNLRDCPPFASVHDVHLADAGLHAVEEDYAEARGRVDRGEIAAAIPLLKSVIARDAIYAEAHFLLARCLDRQGDAEGAWTEFGVARDDDALRFRADSRIRTTVANMAAEFGEKVRYFDAQAIFQSAAPSTNVFWDHVHLNFDGNYLLSSEICGQWSGLRGAGPLSELGTLSAMSQVVARLSFTPIEEWQTLVKVKQRYEHPPFTFQYGHDGELSAISSQVDVAAQAALGGQHDQWIRRCREAAEGHPEDVVVQTLWANRLLGEMDLAGAQAQAETALRLTPHRLDLRAELARIMAMRGNEAGARQVIAETPGLDAWSHAHALFYVAKSLDRAEDRPASIEFLQAALQLDPREDAYRAALAHAPRPPVDGAAHLASARTLLARRMYDRAEVELLEARKSGDAASAAHQMLAELYRDTGRWRDARNALVAAATSSVPDVARLNDVAWLLATTPEADLRDGATAVKLAELAATLTSRSNPVVLDTLSAAYAEAGDFAAARQNASNALQLSDAHGNTSLSLRIRGRLELYESGQPYRTSKGP